MENEMEYTVSYDAAMSWLRIKVTGYLTVQGITEMSAEVVGVARSKNCGYALFDYTDAIDDLSTTEIFEFMSQLDKLGIERSYVVAMVYAQGEEKHRFAETVAYNRGWTNLRYFLDIGQAERWLSERRSS